MSKQRAKLVVGNWKMHGRLAENGALLTEVAAGASALQNGVRVGVCVPCPYLAQSQALLGGSVVAWGVQDVSAYEQGAYTGEVAAEMAADFGATYAIVGHSERRAYHRETLRSRRGEGASRAGSRPHADRVRRRDARTARHRCDGAGRRHAARSGAAGADGRAGGEDRGRVRTRLGDRHGQERERGARRSRFTRSCARSSRRRAQRSRTCRCSTAAASSRRMHRNCSRSRISTAG